MIVELNENDIEMIRNELSYSRCLYWDGKLKNDNNYCDGECHTCIKTYTIEKWIEDKTIKNEGTI